MFASSSAGSSVGWIIGRPDHWIADCPIVGQSQCAPPRVRHAKDCRTILVVPDTPFDRLDHELGRAPVSTVDRVAEELRRSLFDGELAPGTKLREVALA